ncbi:MAG: beta-galactosidase [Chitinophagaceae bacterium]|nr:beta-galactosidase [Chitinophagaceae bacterium]
MKYLVSALLLLASVITSFAQNKIHRFTLGKEDFLLDGKPLQMISGEMHPARIPRAYWRHRIQMAKAMGCNTIAVYIFWNYHETSEGKFDFETGNHNIKAFVQICQEENMWVMFRPGPYVCAEWDFGGLPAYLLKIPDIRIRCMDPRYMAAASRYIEALAKEIVSLQCTKGGPIVMLQIENEYGSFGNDKEYLETVRNIWINNGINVPFYTADGATDYMLEAGNIDGAAIGLDSGSSDSDFEQAKKRNPNVPAFSSETYPGWLTHWGEKWARPDTQDLKKEVAYLLKNKRSVNFYVIHGGTNFGFTAGANAFSATQYQPDITSYDYDAPINEQGLPTPKFFMLRNMIGQAVSYKIPPLPALIKTIEIEPVSLSKANSLLNFNLGTVKTVQPKPLEYFDQNQGLISYKTKLIGHKSGKLKIWEPHDYALVFLNGKFIDTVLRDGGKWEVMLPKTETPFPELEILVEGMGHINFAQFMIDRKGITDRVTLNGMTLMNWGVSLMPMDEHFIQAHQAAIKLKDPTDQRCNFFTGNFNLTETGDTYFDLGNYFKGMLYINGHNLGRYWHIGPQQRLFCPASWLKKGLNEIIVFDFLQTEARPVAAFRTME